jgi:protein-L-isoaspartate(D-aspartate) O-methyltransferase
MTGEKGKVTGVEIVPELVLRGKENIAKYDTSHVRIVQAGKDEVGHFARGPYDKILCTSTADSIPEALVKQLKAGGTIVMPIDGVIVRGIKKRGKLEEERFPGTFSFENLAK